MTKGPEPTRVKICGLTRAEDAAFAAAYGAWAVGVVFHPGSPRYVNPDAAGEIFDAVPAGVLKIGVFMAMSVAEVADIDTRLGLDLVQLHGLGQAAAFPGIEPDRCIMAVTLNDEGDLSRAAYCMSRHILIDRPRTARGPTGGPVDRDLASNLATARPLTLLAGALTPGNVREAVKRVRPFGVDVSSGVESRPGIKDHSLVEAFFDEVRRADREREEK